MSEANNQGNEELTPMTLRERAGLTQLQVAIALGKTPTTVSNWERRSKTPEFSLADVQKLMSLYECSVTELLQAFGTEVQVKLSLLEFVALVDQIDLPIKGVLEVVESFEDRQRRAGDVLSISSSEEDSSDKLEY